jgi:hypothetical protein
MACSNEPRVGHAYLDLEQQVTHMRPLVGVSTVCFE